MAPGSGSQHACAPAAARGTSAATQLQARSQELAGLSHQLLLDLDDTLITNMALFIASRDAIAPLLVALDRYGRDETELIDLHEQASADLYPIYGATPKRWRTATVQTGALVARRPLTPDEEDELLAAAEHAFGNGALYPGVTETLELLYAHGIRLGLVTKGVHDLQNRKIAAHGLARFFDGRIAIVDHKDAQLLQELAAQFGFEAPLVIGDSAASDVAPAQAAGYPAVQIDHGDNALIWKHESWSGGDAPKVGSFPEAILLLLDRHVSRIAA